MRQIFITGLCLLIVCRVASAQEDWMPDPNLRRAVQEALELPDEIPLTQVEMQRLTSLDAYRKEITDLTGMEHATNIAWLSFAEKSDLEQMALHDLYFCCLIFNQQFRETPEGKRVVGEMSPAIELRDAYLAQNPNMLFIAGLEMREAYPTSHREDSPYWLRDGNGERVIAWWDGGLLLDFTKSIVIDKIVEEAVAVSKCGLYDGIFRCGK